MAGKLGAVFVGALEFLGAALLLMLMLVVFVDVGGRSLFSKPLPWGTELLEVVLAAMIFCIYPLLGLRGNHITVDLIQVRPSVRRVQRVLAGIIGFIVFGIVTWCLARQAIRSTEYNDASALLQIPTGMVLWFMCALSGLTAVAFILSTRRAFTVEVATAHPHLE
ncbi:MAG: TRAP transporter small permease [Pseudomonadota bacterium]